MQKTITSAVVLAVLLVAPTGCGHDAGTPATTSTSAAEGAPVRGGALRPVAPPPPSSRFDPSDPQIARLDPALRRAVEAAAADAARDGVRLEITSGWRSRSHQQRLLDEAVARYGSLEEALRFVSTPDRSAHVTGHAVDIGPTEADDWLSRNGSAYGLCQSFANEIWHFELTVEPGGTCPAPIPDSSYR